MLGQLSAYSAYGKGVVSLAAPGEYILVFDAEAENGYCYKYGTSFAAPHVTGALVLLLSAFPNCTVLLLHVHTLLFYLTYIHTLYVIFPLCKVSQVVQRLLNTVDPSSSLQNKCRAGGRLNIGNAVNKDLTGDFGVLRSMYVCMYLLF
jgi:subtilisin family serine protease